MAGTIPERELSAAETGGVSFSVATEQDEGEIRSLLRDTPMPGRISLSFEREPNFFADPNFPSEIKQTIVARDRGQLVCVGSCAIRPRYVNGKPRLVGYLGGLRLDARCAGRFSILRRGYGFFHQLQHDGPADFYFTSIAADNQGARTFLERGLAGMPRYEFICEFVTLVISTLVWRKSRSMTRNVVCPDSLDELLGFLNEHNSAYQFAPYWSAEELLTLHEPPIQHAAPTELGTGSGDIGSYRHGAPTELFTAVHGPNACAKRNEPFQEPGLHASNLCVVRNDQQLQACGALWDQRQFKQVVVRGYSTVLAKVRPALNFFSSLTRQPRLPAVGETLSIAFASHLASKTDASLLHLIQQLANSARRRGIELLTLGFASNDPRLEIIRQNLRCHQYRSRLYVVSWPGIGGTARELDNRLLAPEVALL
jgi:hypothetical protein